MSRKLRIKRMILKVLILTAIPRCKLAIPHVCRLSSWVTRCGFGEESMRYSLLLVTSIVLPWAGWHYVRAGRTIDQDLSQAREYD